MCLRGIDQIIIKAPTKTSSLDQIGLDLVGNNLDRLFTCFVTEIRFMHFFSWEQWKTGNSLHFPCDFSRPSSLQDSDDGKGFYYGTIFDFPSVFFCAYKEKILVQ